MHSCKCIYCHVFPGYTWQDSKSKVGDEAGLTLGGAD